MTLMERSGRGWLHIAGPVSTRRKKNNFLHQTQVRSKGEGAASADWSSTSGSNLPRISVVRRNAKSFETQFLSLIVAHIPLKRI